jgi:hypothetical protein
MRPRFAATTLLAILGVALAVGCTTTSPTVPPASAGAVASPPLGSSVPASGAPPTGPTPAPTYDPETLLLVAGSAAAVVVDRLPVQTDPSAASAIPGAFLRGDVVVLGLFEPIEVDGRLWQYATQVETPEPGSLPELPTHVLSGEFVLRGWIAARDATGDTVRDLAPRCPEVVDLDNVAAMLASERLACFANDPITLDGRFGCVGCSGDELTYVPEWLAGQPTGMLSDVAGQGPGAVPLHFPPALEAPDENTPIRVTGHFDDSRASTCVITAGAKAVDQAVAVHHCRQAFVVDSFEPLSTEYVPPPD